jgi:Gly-Xaa carboxypeptidase
MIKYLFTTSVAVDIINGGVKANALPERVTALINHRVNVGDHVSDVQDKMTGLATELAKKYNLTVHAFSDEEETPFSITLKDSLHSELEPAPVTPTSIDGVTPYSILSGTTRALFGTDVFMAPGIMTGNTDTKFYWDLTKHIFRYDPSWDIDDNQSGVHTIDENVSILAHIRGAKFYSLFLRNMDEAELP